MDVKQPGDLVYLLGRTRLELGGSEYYDLCGFLGRSVPEVDAFLCPQHFHPGQPGNNRKDLIASCHDLSDGGLGVALAESAFAGGLGLQVDSGRDKEAGAPFGMICCSSRKHPAVSWSRSNRKTTAGLNRFSAARILTESARF